MTIISSWVLTLWANLNPQMTCATPDNIPNYQTWMKLNKLLEDERSPKALSSYTTLFRALSLQHPQTFQKNKTFRHLNGILVSDNWMCDISKVFQSSGVHIPPIQCTTVSWTMYTRLSVGNTPHNLTCMCCCNLEMRSTVAPSSGLTMWKLHPNPHSATSLSD